MVLSRKHNLKPGTVVGECRHFRARFAVWGRVVLVFSLLSAGFASSVHAASVVLKIRAINPSKTEKQPVEVKSFLPKPAVPADVVDTAGLDMAYDVASKTYYVRKTVELDPGQTRTFEVQLKDIWIIPEATLTEMEQHASALSAALKGTAQSETATRLGGVLAEGVKGVVERQNAFAVGAAKPIDHIRAYEFNMEALERIRRDIGMLENLAIAAGKDPGKLMGASRVAPPPESGRGEGGTGDVVVIHIKVTNPSLTEKKSIPLRRDFPSEVQPTDVIDAGGLQIGFDGAKGVCYAFMDAVDLAPQESKVFDLKLRNPWAGADDWVPRIETRARELSDIAKRTEAYKSVIQDIEAVLRELEAVKVEKAPGVMNEDYVAYSRRRAETLRGLEGRLMRLEELFQPHGKPQNVFDAPVLNVKPPSRQTTWMIIYIILGFLALVSLLFYLRWYGKSKAEKSEGAGAEQGKRE